MSASGRVLRREASPQVRVLKRRRDGLKPTRSERRDKTGSSPGGKTDHLDVVYLRLAGEWVSKEIKIDAT